MEVFLPIEEHVSGQLARIVRYRRVNGRCPASAFLDELDRGMANKFKGLMNALMIQGASYRNPERFRDLHGAGRPLWEFKQFDHRLYCDRRATGQFIVVVLFNGWVKQKRGRTDVENREIERALGLYQEFLGEYPGGNI